MEQMQLIAHTLGAIYYYGPDSVETEAIMSHIRNGEIATVLNNFPLQAWQNSLDERTYPNLNRAWHKTFLGPQHFIAPPWGSVYLDKENVIFGESLLDLREFMLQHGILFENLHDEAEDHVGIALLLLAHIIQEQPELVNTFLEDHLLPWLPTYLQCLKEANAHPFINELSDYTKHMMEQWQESLSLTPADKTLYWPPQESIHE